VASTNSVRDLARWLDADPGAYALKGPASFEGPMVASVDQVALVKASLKMDAGESIWDTQVRFGELRPQVTGNITWRWSAARFRPGKPLWSGFTVNV